MGLLTLIDRLIQAGGTGVTLAFWLLSIVGAVLTTVGPLPIDLSLYVTAIPIGIVWMRFRNITLAELVVRAGLTNLRYGRDDD